MLRVNVEAPVVLAHAFLRQAVRGDALVNLSSVVAFMPQPAQPVYTATKAFITALTETLWQNANDRGIKVFAVHPGATDTEFAGPRGPRPQPPPSRASFARSPSRWRPRRCGRSRVPGAPNVVTGLPNRLFCSIARLLPRKLLLALMSRLAR